MNATRNRRQGGFTLIEFSLVVGLMSLVLLAVLAGYTHVNDTEKQRQLYAEIATIRKAVTNWAAGGLLFYDGTGVCSDPTKITQATCTSPAVWTNDPGDLLNWEQIKSYLPHPLNTKATTTTTLANINPYGGHYIFRPATSANPRQWKLEVTNLPDGLKDMLEKHIAWEAGVSMTFLTGIATFTINE